MNQQLSSPNNKVDLKQKTLNLINQINLSKTGKWLKTDRGILVGSIGAALILTGLSELTQIQIQSQSQKKFAVQTILALNADATAGTTITPELLKKTEVLVRSSSSNMTTPDLYEKVIGKKLSADLKSGDPLLLSVVEGVTTNPLTSRIPEGKRLFSLQLDDKVLSQGWIKPNDHIDILVTMDLPSRGSTTFVLLQNITLVTVGKATVWNGQAAASGTDISFFVTLSEMELLRFAQQKAVFSLALRNPNDLSKRDMKPEEVGHEGVDLEKFLNNKTILKASGGSDVPVTIGGKKS